MADIVDRVEMEYIGDPIIERRIPFGLSLDGKEYKGVVIEISYPEGQGEETEIEWEEDPDLMGNEYEELLSLIWDAMFGL